MRVIHSHMCENIRKLNSNKSRKKRKGEFCLSWMISRIPPGNMLLGVFQFICFCSVTTSRIIKEAYGRSLKITIWSSTSLAWMMKLFSSLSRMLWCFEVQRNFSNYQQFFLSLNFIFQWSDNEHKFTDYCSEVYSLGQGHTKLRTYAF